MTNYCDLSQFSRNFDLSLKKNVKGRLWEETAYFLF